MYNGITLKVQYKSPVGCSRLIQNDISFCMLKYKFPRFLKLLLFMNSKIMSFTFDAIPMLIISPSNLNYLTRQYTELRRSIKI